MQINNKINSYIDAGFPIIYVMRHAKCKNGSRKM